MNPRYPVLVLTLVLTGCGTDVPATIVREGVVFDLEPDAAPTESAATEAALLSSDALDIREEAGTMPTRPLTEWSRAELADALRARMMAPNGHLYLQREPNFAAADRILAGGVPVPHDRDWVPSEGDRDGARAGLQEESIIIGTDGRTVPASTTAHPFDSVVRLEFFRNGTPAAWCTGSYIGPWTVLTSAHCLLQANGPVTQINFQAGRQGSSFPFGNVVCRTDDTLTSNDVTYYTPAGFDPSNPGTESSGSFDYAVIDTFPCHSTTRFFHGYLVNPNDETYSMYGYPSGQCPGTSGNAGNWMCGMAGPAYDNGWRLETEHIDGEGGQSGSPWFRFTDRWRVVGPHRGWRSYFDFGRCGFDNCVRNYARLIDDSVDDFIVFWSYDY